MCVVSMIGDNFRDRWDKTYPVWPDGGSPKQPIGIAGFQLDQISRAEFEALKREVEILKSLLKDAKKYDEVNGEPNCELDEKLKFLREVAKLVGVDLDDVLGK